MTTAAEHMATALLRLAGAERDSGNELRAEIFEAAADLTGATCSTCGAPLIGGVADVERPVVPVDGREVDRAPESQPSDLCPESRFRNETHSWRFDGDDPYVICTFCGEVRDAPTGRVIRTPPTGDGAAGPPAPAPSPHFWIGADRECFCLIGDDHVAEPRFEKES